VANTYAPPVQSLIDELGRLPGIGPKSAQRIAFHLLKLPAEDARRLARVIVEAKEKVTFCTQCWNVAEGAQCGICTDTRRDPTVVCVVEEARDVVALEKTGEFHGRYHVLLGAISPIDGVGPEHLKVRELLVRLEPEGITEVILCTNPTIEGEATALYLARLLKPLGVTVTRLASGLPVGGDLEYADELTLGRALEGRRTMDGEAWIEAYKEILGFELDDAGWRYWEAFNLFKGACANVTALRVFADGTNPAPNMLQVGTSLHGAFLRRLVDLVAEP
jgi:recombination protein RecR